VLMEHVRE
jgi:ATP-dependent RNA helicase DDX10/DBP4